MLVKYSKLVAILLTFGLTCGTAIAEEPISLDRFDGGYLGAQVGVGTAAAKFTIATIQIFDSDVTGGSIGMYGGYGWQRGRRYLGVEVSGGYSGVKNGNLLPVLDTPWITGEIERVYGITLLGKAGRVVGEDKKTLVYGLLGPSIIRVEARASLTGLGSVSGSTLYPGLSIGAGVEHFFNDKFSGRVQGMFTRYYRADDVFKGLTVQKYDLDTFVVQFGVTRWFGR